MKNRKPNLNKLIWLVTVSGMAVLLSILLASYVIERSTKNYVFSDVEKIPYNKVGLLLGTSKYLHSGLPNEYFLHRIEGATKIFQAKKIKYIVISGDNSKVNYNEPLDMKMELVRNGVPDSLIRLDYAGFRTYDSVIRLNRIFGQSSFTIISQEFHNKRAVYIARKLGMIAVGYNAEDVTAYNGFKTRVREKFARVKVFIDLLTNKKPKFLGEPIEIK